VISHKHKYIFIHIPKTGGSSTTLALLKNENIILPDINFPLHHLYKSQKNSYKLKIEEDGKILHEEHYPLDKFDLEFQKSYYCFTFVRNPWDVMVSTYFFNKKYRNHIINTDFSFEDFLLKNKMRPSMFHTLPQHSFINDNINYIGRFENLQQDFDKICEYINIPKQQLPHKYKTERMQYQDYYTEETKNFVAVKYKKDIEMFNYKF
jgi:hypothetical protein